MTNMENSPEPFTQDTAIASFVLLAKLLNVADDQSRVSGSRAGEIKTTATNTSTQYHISLIRIY